MQTTITSITRHKFSKTKQGINTQFFRLDNGTISVDICDYGATILAIRTPDKSGNVADIVLGYGTVAEYEENGGYFGATIGRYANRIANGEFSLNNKKYTLIKNDGDNHLHGGIAGFDKQIWDCEIVENGVSMSIISEDMDEGYPGTLQVSVCFTLTNDTLSALYQVKSDKDTIINMTNHSYFNLNGHNKGDILRHTLKIPADRFTRVRQGAIPTGELPQVLDTPFDFRTPHKIGERLTDTDEDLKVCGGYDHNFCLGETRIIREAAVLSEEYSGRRMTVKTDLPGIQLYIGNMIEPVAGKSNAHYGKRSGLCLETQFFPDSPNHTEFPSCLIKAGEEWSAITAWQFDTFEN